MFATLITAIFSLHALGIVPPLQNAPGPVKQVDLVAAPLAAGKQALAAGKPVEAVHHLLQALEFAPDSAEVMGLLLDATANDVDAHTLWSHAFATATPAANAFPARGDDPHPAALAAQRVAALDELLKLARDKEKEGASRPEALLVACFARRFALDVASASPALLAAHADELSPRLKVPEGLPAKVVKALEAFGNSALTNGRTADAIKAARILAGLGTQIGWDKDLQGPKPAGVGNLKSAASGLLVKARAQLGNKEEKPWSVDELYQLDGDQAEAFTREHSTFANPGLAVSPQGWYRVETDCGFETLLGVATTIEQHHQRLASWYGVDPFVGRPGLARVVPEASGLEAEGAPFWWAGGFQGGDTTTVRFSCGTIEGLGHLLTHELTHRFDGAIYPGIPSWLAEGKAVWTGGAYGRAADEGFVAQYASIGTIEYAQVKGYGDPNNLTRLIEGTIDDYRDNYVAGYALYVYLNTRRVGGRVLFHDRLEKFMKEARTVRGKWKEPFVGCFCDGKEGRPKDFEGFVADWAPWLAGFYWQVRKDSPWVQEYTENVGGADSPLVMDEPTWVWSRNRAEPRFGQEQAALAGRLFLDAGRRQDGIAALVWALAVDGRRPEEEGRLAEALHAEGRKEAAWCVQTELAFPYGARAGGPPFASALTKTLAWIAALEAAAEEAKGRRLAMTSSALLADRERLASWLGLPRLESGAPIDVSHALHPFDLPPRPLAAGGYRESGLTGFEERRVKGLWYVDEEGDLQVGRTKPRQSTGTVDRGSAQVDAFALAPEWVLPGTWRLDARIRFTTSFLHGAVIFGYAERESNLRFHFDAGDFLYAIGASSKEPEFKSIGWSVTGLRDRDGGLPGATTGGGFNFGGTASKFELSLLVDGSLVEVAIDGKPVGRYQTVDGAAIEGQIGFASGMGAFEVERARVTRLERSRLAPSSSLAPTGFDLSSTRSLAPWESHNRTAFGITPVPQGTLLLWLAPPNGLALADEERASFMQRLTWDLRELAALVERMQPTQRLLVAAPRAIGDAGLAEVTDYAKKVIGARVDVVLHDQPFVPDGVATPKSRRWLLFIDNAGVIRALSEIPTGQSVADDGWFRRWMNVLRDHGRPERELPKVERPKVPAPQKGAGKENHGS